MCLFYRGSHLAKSYLVSEGHNLTAVGFVIVTRERRDLENHSGPRELNKGITTRGTDADLWRKDLVHHHPACVCVSECRVQGWLLHWRQPFSCCRSGSALHFLTCQLGQAKHGAFWHRHFYINQSRWQLQSWAVLTWCHSKHWSPNPRVNFCMLCVCVRSESEWEWTPPKVWWKQQQKHCMKRHRSRS